MPASSKRKPAPLSDRVVAERVQSIVINAALGRRSVGDDDQYSRLRPEIMKRFHPAPHLVATHPSVDSLVAFMKGIVDRGEREERVRRDFAPLIHELDGNSGPVDASAWTGEVSRASRLAIVRETLPLAEAAVESMIATLSEPNPNGAPLLDGREEALGHLRQLHRTLGELLGLVDAGSFDDDLGQSLAAEAARYAKRAARALRDDPMPYLAGSLLLGLLSACGLPGIGGYLAGIALNVKKHATGPSSSNP